MVLHPWERLQKMLLDFATAQWILLKCTGDEIWNETTCRNLGIPENWIEELVDNYESGFDSDRNTIYVSSGDERKDSESRPTQERVVNQYRGVLDLHLAYKLAEFLGIDWQRATAQALTRRAEVAAIQAELDEI